MNRVVPLAVIALLAALCLVACGGSSSSDEDQIRDISSRALTANDPSSCEEIATERFIQTAYGGSIDQCKKNAEETSDTPDSVDTGNISIDADKATAEITLNGGPSDGETLLASYVKEDGQWKFDTVSQGTGTSTDGAISGTSSTGTSTTTGDRLSGPFFATIRTLLKRQGLADEVADCIVGKLQVAISPKDLADLNAGKTKFAHLAPNLKQASEECARQALAP